MAEVSTDYLKLIDDICKVLSTSVETLRCAEDNPQHRYILALYSSIIDFTKAYTALAARNLFTALPAIERSFFEAYVDLKNLFNDPQYYFNMLAANNEQKLRWAKALSKMEPDDDRLLDEVARIQQELNQIPRKSMPVLERFTLAEMTDVYRLVYGPLCAETHNNLYALRDRYLVNDDSSYRISYNKRAASAPKQRIFNLRRMVRCLIQAYVVLQKKFGVVDNDVLSRIITLNEHLKELLQVE